MLSKMQDTGLEINFPNFKPRKLYMHKIDLSRPILPEGFEDFGQCVESILGNKFEGIGYVTIDVKKVEQGLSHRRGGAHIDGNYIFGWGGGSGWLTGENGRILSPEKHKLQYCSDKGGMLIVSDYSACKAWQGEYSEMPKQGGNCEHVDLSKLDSFILSPNKVYLANSTCIHESLPVDKTVNRSLIRITLPHTIKVF